MSGWPDSEAVSSVVRNHTQHQRVEALGLGLSVGWEPFERWELRGAASQDPASHRAAVSAEAAWPGGRRGGGVKAVGQSPLPDLGDSQITAPRGPALGLTPSRAFLLCELSVLNLIKFIYLCSPFTHPLRSYWRKIMRYIIIIVFLFHCCYNKLSLT